MQHVPCPEQPNYESLLYHIVLPRVLPQERFKDYDQQNLELLWILAEEIESSEWIPPATKNFFNSFKKTHTTRTTETITQEINALKPGESFAMFIDCQNCALMIHMPLKGNNEHVDETTSVVVSTFPGNLHPKEIYVQSSDLQVRN